jgi:hypothetical protein
MPQILSDAIPASATLANSWRCPLADRAWFALQSTIDRFEQRVAGFRDQATLAASTDFPGGE